MKEKILSTLRRKGQTVDDLVAAGFSEKGTRRALAELSSEGLVKTQPVKTGKRGRPKLKYLAVR